MGWQQYQTIPDPDLPVKCRVCGRDDVLWFCSPDNRAPSDLDIGQYRWKWTRCCDEFMELVKTK